MNFFGILKRDLLFYWRNNIGTLLLAGVCCAVLTGAMLVGDSVQSSLLRLGQMRLGKTQYACSTGDRFFRQELAKEMAEESAVPVSAVLYLQGILESADGSVRVNNVNIYGVDETFWKLAMANPQLPDNWPVEGAMLLSQSVQSRIGDSNSDLLLRIEPVPQLSRDLIFADDQTRTQAWAVQVAGVIADDAMGRFSLQTQQDIPLNVFVPIEWLAEKTNHQDKANMILIGEDPTGLLLSQHPNSTLDLLIQPEDLGLEIRKIESKNVIELRTSRIFLEKPIADAAMKAGNEPFGVFTYFVNEIRLGQKSVPYSMVTAESENGAVPALGKNEIAINEWLADELGADIGDEIEVTFFQLTPTRKLVEQTTTFQVRRVVPMMGPFADPTLMPDYPGLSEAKNCRDWDPGIPIDLNKIQRRDEDYWDRYGGTPKAFISMESARDIWSNRFGSLTAVRYRDAKNTESQIRSALLENINPADVGFTFRDVQAAAQTSAAGSTDFSGLFGGLSMFLIFSAAILLSLIFIFYVESRANQIGLLLAVGWGWLKIFCLFMVEGAALALVGCVAGAIVSVLYSKGLIFLLNTTFWANALANLQLVFDAKLQTMMVGICVSFLICLFAIQLALFHRIRKPVHQLLTGAFENYSSAKKPKSQMTLWMGLICLGGAILLPFQSELKQSQTASFFVTGILLLLAVFFLSASCLKWLRVKSASFARSLTLLAVKNIPRRTGRSLTVLITLACGVFVVIGVGANYKNIGAEVQHRNSGTGGFALMAQTTIPMTAIPTLTEAGRNGTPPILSEAVVPLRVYQQDDASCLNLNRAQQPTLLGVQPERFVQREAFDFQKSMDDENDASAWLLLDKDMGKNIIPAIGDYSTVVWGLKKNLGDKISYRDENGQVVRLQIAGILKDSVLQGRLLISENHFIEHFPSVDGYQLFLIDADWNDLHSQLAQMTKQYRDFGMEIIPTIEKLARFHEVENTYLAIFLVLGGLGLILGSAGLGLVLVLNVLDRKGELAMMQAVGFRKPQLSRMLFFEHGLLLLGGVLGGFVPAVLAVFPVIRTQSADFPYGIIFCTVIAMLISGAVWVRIAIGGVLKMNFLETLRNQ
ncbi:MAG: ABC transporter permease [Phycisphaerae bacterium]|nr:ABC transporter permease [Phycisphaerae bacterium]